MFKTSIEYKNEYLGERDYDRMFNPLFLVDKRPAWVRANDAPKRRRK